MKRVFADSFYFFALLSDKDDAHERALAWSRSFRGQVFTTEWVLVEVADGMASSRQREFVPKLRRDLLTDTNYRVESIHSPVFELGNELYEKRNDKKWSLTDCISFVVMEREKITEALTGDHHFVQAGFTALLK